MIKYYKPSTVQLDTKVRLTEEDFSGFQFGNKVGICSLKLKFEMMLTEMKIKFCEKKSKFCKGCKCGIYCYCVNLLSMQATC